MSELLEKIYKNIICYESDAIQMGKEIDSEIYTLIKPYECQISDKEMEELKTLLYGIALSAECAGFWLGVKYALKITTKLLSD